MYAWHELYMMGVCQNGILKIFAIKIPPLKKHHSTSSFGLFLDSFGVPQLSIGKAMAVIMSTLVAFQGSCSLLISLYKCFAYYGCNGGVRNRSSSRICLFKFLIKIVVSAYICLCSFSEIFYPHSAQKIHRACTFSTSSLKFSSCPCCFWNTLHMPSYIQRLPWQVEHEILASYAKHWLTVEREITAGLFPLSKNTCNLPSDGEAYEGIAHLMYIAKQSLPVAFFQCSRHANIRVTWVKHNAGRLCCLSRQLRNERLPPNVLWWLALLCMRQAQRPRAQYSSRPAQNTQFQSMLECKRHAQCRRWFVLPPSFFCTNHFPTFIAFWMW